ncbi:CaiB/BaiF CoA transferase family protein [Pimelobacter simplex]|uniref:CaiB/BaiF CoA transferase family protein n=1 Tax=Nocardioides simplex TaxID=2045 RepID=UPI00214FAE45|nr:CoA transferase [Pimelobacter simplex]UUW91426.1 CoA transferase [Pimelobacter simplex]UUW95254.1 CoA transferase [Pimelobacter simplex]
MSRDLPLHGIRVLDLTRALSGPFCTALLGDLGADVIKIESPEGDVGRAWGPYDEGESLYFLAANRNKRSVALRLWSDDGKALLRRLAEQCDVLVENFRPGVLDALGLGEDWRTEHAPDLVVSSISGFGHVGPMRDEPCFDQVAQGMSGFMSLTGSAESGPTRAGVPLADLVAGVFAALGICAALAAPGRGRTVHTSLLEGMIGLLGFQAQALVSLGQVAGPAGNRHPVVAPYGVFATADGAINLAAATEQQWQRLCAVLERTDLVGDPRFARPADRSANRDELQAEIEKVLRAARSSYWLDELRRAEIPAGPIHDLAGVFADAQVAALHLVDEVEHPVLGTVPMIRGPLWIDGEPLQVRRTAPGLGEHTDEVLAELGLNRGES